MSRLSDIAVRVEGSGAGARGAQAPGAATLSRSGGLGGGVAAVLSELAGMLEKVALGGHPDMIDLRSLPMSPEDRLELQTVLGQGEVHATLSAEGTSSLQETGVSGLWWVEHRDREGELIAELIEVATIPTILQVSTDDMGASARWLRDRMNYVSRV